MHGHSTARAWSTPPHTAVTQMSTTSVFTSTVQSDCTTSGYLAMLRMWEVGGGGKQTLAGQ